MKTVVFYDDLCGVCNYWVNWILENDNRDVFYFAPLTSDFATDFSHHFQYDFPQETIVLWNENVGFLEKSDAVVFILQSIKPSSFSSKALKLFPKFIRNTGYSTFAYFRRYIQMGECRIPSSTDKKRFLTNHSLQSFFE